MITTLLFDFDGTLADTYSIIFHSFKTIFKEFKGEIVTDQFIFRQFGPAEPELIRRNFNGRVNHELVLERYYEVYDRDHLRLTPVRADVAQMLNGFAQYGFRLGVITGKSRRSLGISLAHLFPTNRFDVSVTGDEIARPKPHPESLEKALNMLKVNPKEAVFIGDTDDDFLAGRALNMATIGVRWFHSNDAVPWTISPDIVFHDVASFEKHILSFL